MAPLLVSERRKRTKIESCRHTSRKCVGWRHGGEQDARAGMLPCAVRGRSRPPSLQKAFGNDSDLAQEFGRGFQVPVGSIDVDVTEVGGQGQHVLADSLTASWRRLQCPDRKRVAK